MAFRKPKKQPQFADLKGILAQSKDTENALYQTVQEIIERLTQLQLIINEDIAKAGTTEGLDLRFATRFGTYITKNDEHTQLPNSLQLIAGDGIELDYTVPNKLTINSSGGAGNYYDSPLTDGDIDETELIFANGDCIIVQVPNEP